MKHVSSVRRAALGLGLTLMLSVSVVAQPAIQSKSFGTSKEDWYRISPMEFLETYGEMRPGLTWNPNPPPDQNHTYRTQYGSLWQWVTPHLPTGARLTTLELDACDTAPDANLEVSLWDCDQLSNCALAPLGTISTTALAPLDCGTLTLDLSAAQYTVDNHKHLLFVFARENQLVTDLLLAGVAIGYKLQVSPAPATATFNDVPATDPGFQYIEALAASGITGGCGGGNYCPDSSLTRRQMAVFLAKALGLSY